MMAALMTPNRAQDIQSSALKTGSNSTGADFADAKQEVRTPKAPDPFNVVELALELATERMRTVEAMKARDAVVQRLVDAHESIRQKTAALELLQQKSRATSPFLADSASTPEKIEMARMKDEIARLERTIVELRIEIRCLKESAANLVKPIEPPPRYDEGAAKSNIDFRPQPELSRPPTRPAGSPNVSQTSQISLNRSSADKEAQTPDTILELRMSAHTPASDEPADMIAARNAILAELALPQEIPDDTLSPLSIPAPLTLQEFISSLSGPLRTSLAHYRIFYASTTHWCPEREEHGYFYAPAYKCSTNPRVATAHRWGAVDVISRMNKPTECFFNKDGIWYYAGVYKAFRLADLTTKEWAALPFETTQAIVKETIAARKNTSPQNVYEINQLYAAGALRVACVGLQCIGFNNAMYAALIEQAHAFAHSKWAGVTASTNVNANASGKGSPAPASVAGGLGPAAAWSTGAAAGVGGGSVAACGAEDRSASVPPAAGPGDVVAAVAGMSLGRQSQNGYRSESAPAPIGEGRKR
ncbi:hypothetical protein LshimejAT787_0211880 [Lyophyllum shimeji]|uniref:DUF6697 domain-containing protein n=1 Tax=Lyophyllum shimeji TaxID=47721 RepID=A0A9P3PGQ2_LYOSH|nr:hypothetical protein LshimejAT787_0211880 [Lyophyllum shimeji]